MTGTQGNGSDIPAPTAASYTCPFSEANSSVSNDQSSSKSANFAIWMLSWSWGGRPFICISPLLRYLIMAASFASRLHAIERDLSGVHHPRDTPTASSSSATPSYTGTPGVNGHLSTSVKALAGFFTVIGLIVIAIVAWKVYACRKRKATRAPSSHINISIAEKGISEKQAFHLNLADDDVKDIKAPNKATLLPAVPQTPSVGWVPQVRTVYQPGPLAPLPSAVKPPSRSP
ncbi:hypothetical protein EVG20_g9950, partial [Dentipellis fragilis]